MIQNIFTILAIIILIYVLIKAGLIKKIGGHIIDTTAKGIAKFIIFVIILLIFGFVAQFLQK
jgi:di/tricarboxylate transporter